MCLQIEIQQIEGANKEEEEDEEDLPLFLCASGTCLLRNFCLFRELELERGRGRDRGRTQTKWNFQRGHHPLWRKLTTGPQY